MRRLKRSAQRAAAASQSQSQTLPNTSVRFSASKRIPSWNCIARENSTGSLDEEVLTEVASLQQVSTSAVSGSSSNRHHRTFRTKYEGSDSESETIDLNTWTRSGGPLMRTASANMFIDFVQGLDMDVGTKQSLAEHLNSVVMQTVSRESRGTTPDRNFENAEYGNRGINGSRITVAEGDLLQPERIQNGIIFNVVKKEELTVSGRSNDSESFTSLPSPAAECVHLECPERETDASSESEHNDDENTHIVDPSAHLEDDSSSEMPTPHSPHILSLDTTLESDNLKYRSS